MKDTSHVSRSFPLLIVIGLLLLYLTSCNSGASKYEEILNNEQSKETMVETTWTPDDETDVVDISDQDDPDRDVRPAEPKPESQKPSVANEGYQIQLGAFIKSSNATRLRDRLQNSGYQPFILESTINNREWNIVRLGPFKERAQAYSLAEELSRDLKMDIALYFKGRVIKLFEQSTEKPEPPETKTADSASKPAPPKTAAQSAPAKDSNPMPAIQASSDQEMPFSFQIGGLYTAENAKKYLKAYQTKGYTPYLVEVQDEISNETWYSIRIGKFQNMEDAVDAARAFTDKEAIPAQVRPLGY